MIITSEYVALGHPDKMADYISSKLLDAYLSHDPNVRYAVEVLIKDDDVFLAGEVTSVWEPTLSEIKSVVREAIQEIGYTAEYSEVWGDDAIRSEDINVIAAISKQSPDIAQGVDRGGWGDQGIFWGYANDLTWDGLGVDHSLARRIGRELYSLSLINPNYGLDIKTQVTFNTVTKRVLDVTVAIPMRGNLNAKVKDIVQDLACQVDFDLTINGTGVYTTHSSVGDAGVTGRKLAVDFYGGDCKVGGGSPWGKDGSKADVTLNILARKLALENLRKYRLDECITSLSCSIGSSAVRVNVYDKRMNQRASYLANYNMNETRDMFELRTPIFSALCRNGLFSRIK